jgi:hypothetical protein
MVTSFQKVLRSRTSRAAILPAVLALALMLGATPALAKNDGPHLPFKGTLQAVESGVFNPALSYARGVACFAGPGSAPPRCKPGTERH